MHFPLTRRREILEGYPFGAITLHTRQDFARMAQIGQIAARTLDHVAPHVRPGVSTAELDHVIHAFMTSQDTVPATIGYHGYRHASCISVNHVAVHGVPSDAKILKEGDILNIDVSPRFDGPADNHWHGDTSRMFTVGDRIPVKARRLITATQDCLDAGIAAARPGNRLGAIGVACERVARDYGYGISTEFCGHGIGLTFHDNPEVLHSTPEDMGPLLRPGMIFTIEPILTIGRPETKILADGWTAVTRDRSLSAQAEHTVGITEDGVEIFTQ